MRGINTVFVYGIIAFALNGNNSLFVFFDIRDSVKSVNLEEYVTVDSHSGDKEVVRHAAVAVILKNKGSVFIDLAGNHYIVFRVSDTELVVLGVQLADKILAAAIQINYFGVVGVEEYVVFAFKHIDKTDAPHRLEHHVVVGNEAFGLGINAAVLNGVSEQRVYYIGFVYGFSAVGGPAD